MNGITTARKEGEKRKNEGAYTARGIFLGCLPSEGTGGQL
jgi:hypothetical protein